MDKRDLGTTESFNDRLRAQQPKLTRRQRRAIERQKKKSNNKK